MARGILWRHRDFRLLWGGETVSELGSQVSVLAIPLLAVRTLHTTTFEVALLAAASTAAFLIVGLPAGVWVDRIRRRWVMMAADIGRMLALASVPIAYALGALTLGQLVAVTLLTGVLTVFFDVAYQSYLPSLVGREHLVEGNAKLTGSAEAATVAGPSVAGLLVDVIGASYAIALDSVSFLVSGAAVAAIRTREPRPEVPEGGHRSLVHDMGEGLRFVFGNVLLRAIAATTATANLFSGISTAVEVVFLVRTVHASPAVIGLMFTLGGLGGVLGALAAGPIARRFGGARATIIGLGFGVGVAPGPVEPAGTPSVAVRVRVDGGRVRRGRLQREPGELPPAPVPGPPARPDECDHAVHRLGRDPDRRAHRGSPRDGARSPDHPLDRLRRLHPLHRVAAGLAHADDARLPHHGTARSRAG